LNTRFFNFLKRLDPINTAFLLSTPIIAIAGVAYLAATGGIHWATIVLGLFWAIFTGFAITGGYHRLFSHKAFDAKWPYRLFVLVFGAAAFENSALRWSSDHRNHHKFVDTDQDPYNIKRGFWYAHMGWVMLKYKDEHRYDNVADLETDPLVQFQNRHYVWLGIVTGFVAPTLLAALWGDALGGLLIAGFLRTVMNHHFTFSINSFAHLFGKQPYSDQNTARDSWFLALFTYGEGYHNFHHKFPSDYRNGIRSYHWDPTKWIVKGLAYVGQTYNLRQMPNERIFRARLQMDQKRLLARIAKEKNAEIKVSHEFIIATRQKIEEAQAQFRLLKNEYKKLKIERMSAFHSQVAHLNERKEVLRGEIQKARQRLEEAAQAWTELCQSFGVRPTRLTYA
jgi:stearoyl-CoA desaturase (delta-9 desaturase)